MIISRKKCCPPPIVTFSPPLKTQHCDILSTEKGQLKNLEYKLFPHIGSTQLLN